MQSQNVMGLGGSMPMQNGVASSMPGMGDLGQPMQVTALRLRWCFSISEIAELFLYKLLPLLKLEPL